MLAQEERNSLGRELGSLAVMYGYDISREQIQVFLAVLAKYLPATHEQYMRAISQYVSDPKNKCFPTPMHLRQYLNPTMSSDGMANEVASRIRAAITKFGYPNGPEARRYIGEAGWEIVKRNGGWTKLCEDHGACLNSLTFHAQARDVARSLLEAASAGKLDEPIELPSPKGGPARLASSKEIISDLVKRGDDRK